MDNWAQRHIGTPYDADGDWASQGQAHQVLLDRMLADPYFARTGPKSTGREYFHEAWLAAHLKHTPGVSAVDVQATLATLTATTIADSLQQVARDTSELYICGGGARNAHLMRLLQQRLPAQKVLPYTIPKCGPKNLYAEHAKKSQSNACTSISS